MRDACWSLVLTLAVATAAVGLADSARAMSFESAPTRSDGSQLADPDEQIEDFGQLQGHSTVPGWFGTPSTKAHLTGNRYLGPASSTGDDHTGWHLLPRARSLDQ